jgi:hypothetical protein
MHRRNIAILVASRGGARLLRRDHDTGALKTGLTIEDEESTEAFNTSGSTEDERLRRHRVAAFDAVIATRLHEALAAQPCEGLVVVAPERMLPDLAAAVGHVSPVLASLAKDLMKVPDHEMAPHLQHVLFEADAAPAG